MSLRLCLLSAALFSSPALAAANDSLPVNLGRLANAALLGGNKDMGLPALNTAQRSALSRQGFVIVPANWRQFDAVYEATRYAEQPVFVTTDSMLHVYHLVFAKILRDLERESLAPTTRRLSQLLVRDAGRQLGALRGTALEKSARTALAYAAVAQELSDPASTPPAEVAAVVDAEVKKILAGQTGPMSLLPDPDLQEVYSQYTPRGHYTGSEALRRYFRTMTWFGRVNLRSSNPEETRVAALLTNLLTQNPEATRLWARIYDPTALLVGKSDDLDYRQYVQILKRVTGGAVRPLGDPGVLAAFQAALAQLPAPQVNSVFTEARPGEGRDVRERETRGFRLMGQRFTLDGAAFQRLVYREVGTDRNPRTLPRGLDLLAGLGSDAALNELRRQGETGYANYLPQLQRVRSSFAALQEPDWTTNVYSGWLYVLQALAHPEPRDARYPAFMRTPAWTRKEMLTALGSWTELRHDTTLYVKQTMAEMGAGEELPPPHAYVEPNARVWTRLLGLEALTRQVLRSQGILSSSSASLLDELRGEATLLRTATGRQLAGQALSREQDEQLRYYGGWLEQMKMASTDPPEGSSGGGTPEFSEKPMAAVIADVASAGQDVLEEGTGFIHELYAVVPDGRGGYRWRGAACIRSTSSSRAGAGPMRSGAPPCNGARRPPPTPG